jgi:16S rRNA (cytosine967-C5)-methyltransferase
MRRTNFNLITDPAAWPQAMRLLESFIICHEKVDSLWEQIPGHASTDEVRSCRGRVLAALRYGHLVNQLIDRSARRPPKQRLRALLLIAGGEWLGSGLAEPQSSQLALTANHAVEIAKQFLSAGEARFVNALLRRWPETLQRHFPTLGDRLHATCPVELLKRWQKQFAPDDLQKLLEWNLGESPSWLYYPQAASEGLPVTLRERTEAKPEMAALWQQFPTPLLRQARLTTERGHSCPRIDPPNAINKAKSHTSHGLTTSLGASLWKDFYQLPAGPIETGIVALLAQGKAYIKDPGTRFAVEWLAPKPGDAVLDLCAAPGGKSFQIAHTIDFKGQLVAIDLPGKRHQRLCENLMRWQRQGFEPLAIAGDLLQLEPPALSQQHGLPTHFPKVVIDVPCSNTGVLRRRPDASWRLDETAIQAMPPLQCELLKAASRWVAAGGDLVYSTCSIEKDENHAVVETFLASTEGRDFRLERAGVHLPWQTGHDGGGVFLLQRN